MTVLIPQVDENTDNWVDFWTKFNQSALAISSKAVTVDSNTAVGNSAITGTFTSEHLVSNTANVSTLTITTGTISTLTTTTGAVETLTSNTANIENGNIASIDANTATITTATIPNFVGLASFEANTTFQDTVTIGKSEISSKTVTLSTLSPVIISQWAMGSVASSKMVIASENIITSDFSSVELLVVHNNVDVFTTEYAQVITSDAVGVITANVAGGNVRIYYQPNDVSDTEVTYHETKILK